MKKKIKKMDRCQSKVGKAMCPADFLSKEVAALSGRIFLRRREKVLDPGMEVTKKLLICSGTTSNNGPPKKRRYSLVV